MMKISYLIFSLLFVLTASQTATRDTYDYIVVGAGAAGSVVATRLSENPDITVAVLEAGGDGLPFIETQCPFLGPGGISELEWGYQSVPQVHAANKVMGLARAKMLGGCTSHNGMIFVRGNPADFDAWAALGNDGWAYDDVLPFFKRLENRTAINPDCADDPNCSAFHNNLGNERISLPSFPFDGINNPWLASCAAEGVPTNQDYNGKEQLGAAIMEHTIYDGARWSTQNGYLNTALDRDNLDILTNHMVMKLNFDATLTATSVVYRVGTSVEDLENAPDQVLTATKEIIVSGGAFNSPQLLMLSGIGPQDHLTEFGIDTLVDLPVGENYHDHPGINFIFTTTDTQTYTPQDKANDTERQQWIDTHTGIYTTPTDSGIAFIQLDPEGSFLDTVDNRAPDMQINFVPGFGGDIGFGATHAIQMAPRILHPFSRGTVRLQSDDPLIHPLLDPNFLADQRDVDALFASVKKTIAIFESRPLKDHIGFFVTPGGVDDICGSVQGPADRKFWECYIRNTMSGHAHPVGTCKMGPAGDPTSVVDNRLRVHGVNNLRVCDASIMPVVTSGNTQCPSIMIGEKCASMVAGDA